MATNVSERMLALADVIDVLAAQSKTIAASSASAGARDCVEDLYYVAGKHAALADAITAVTGLLDALWTPTTGGDDHTDINQDNHTEEE